MKKYKINLVVIVSFLIATIGVQILYTQSYTYAESEYDASQSWLVKWIDSKDEQILSKSEVVEEYADYNISVLKPIEGEDVHNWLNSLNNSSYVEHVQIIASNDEFAALQLYLGNIGAIEAWNTSNENTAITIAIVDTGVDLHHPDLIDNLVEGVNILDRNAPPQDDHGHGTSVAGIVAASGNNGIGVSGILWNANIMPIKALDDTGNGIESDIGEGIRYAVDHGAKVVVLSLGLPTASPYLRDIVQYAEDNDVLIVAASGNDGLQSVQYPAAYPSVLAVGGLHLDKTIHERSNYGQEIDVAAPYIAYTTGLDGTYTVRTGTSVAAPQVAAAAALIWSQYPELKPDQIRNLIRQTAEDVHESGWDEHTGYGLLRIDRALTELAIADIYEENNNKEEAKPLQLDAMMSGALEGDNDEDWFYIESKYDGILKIIFESSSEVDLKDIEMIYHFDDETIIYDLSQQAELSVNADEVGYIQIKYKNQEDREFPYQVTSEFIIEADMYEDNDAQDNAFDITGTNQEILGTFHKINDKDWYVLDVTQEGSLSIELSSNTNRMDLKLTIVNPDGTSMPPIDRGAAGEPEFYYNTVLPGKYYFLVENYEEEGMDSLPIKGNYLFQMTYLPTFVDLNEPNDKAYQTTKLELNSEYKGVFNNDLDEDWFSFSINETKDINIDLSSLPQDQNVTLSVLNSMQNIVFITTNEGQDNIYKQLEGLPSGTYYVKLETSRAFEYQMYTLKVIEKNIDDIFDDIETHWAKEEIAKLWDRGIVNGSDGLFLPDENITRAEAITMVVRAMELNGLESNSSPFIDINEEHWAYESILIANQEDLINGYPDGTFGPNHNLNRVEAVKIIANSLGFEGIDGEVPFNDIPEGYWASGILTQLKTEGLVNGYLDGSFKPTQETSRAEFAVLIYKLLLE
ncbi:S8 family peptidase [Chengkuizengella axinellae]|uniref:S8 family serine peptidase n=1 Tax=Chengkuizengella axinellae TaxID=3064388 RepID=A0ABT9J5E7_9BACL|nr:S8 family serine peptidase [Chengkuizengella sp. 2205SS18-9]MDP5276841.1 S8 family serine peptidase [Chengkuizengella sp. 2205SS18-9]